MQWQTKQTYYDILKQLRERRCLFVWGKEWLGANPHETRESRAKQKEALDSGVMFFAPRIVLHSSSSSWLSSCSILLHLFEDSLQILHDGELHCKKHWENSVCIKINVIKRNIKQMGQGSMPPWSGCPFLALPSWFHRCEPDLLEGKKRCCMEQQQENKTQSKIA